MKSLKQIQQTAKKGDYTRVAEIIGGISPQLVRMVVYELRQDHYDIQHTFSEYLKSREALSRQSQKPKRMAA